LRGLTGSASDGPFSRARQPWAFGGFDFRLYFGFLLDRFFGNLIFDFVFNAGFDLFFRAGLFRRLGSGRAFRLGRLRLFAPRRFRFQRRQASQNIADLLFRNLYVFHQRAYPFAAQKRVDIFDIRVIFLCFCHLAKYCLPNRF